MQLSNLHSTVLSIPPKYVLLVQNSLFARVLCMCVCVCRLVWFGINTVRSQLLQVANQTLSEYTAWLVAQQDSNMLALDLYRNMIEQGFDVNTFTSSAPLPLSS